MLLYSELVKETSNEDNFIDESVDYNLQDSTLSIGKKKLITPPLAETICLIMHTSGTSGEIKGAMLTHRNLLSGYANCDFYGYDYNENDVYLSYIPFNHIYEQLMLGLTIIFGFKIGFLNPMNIDSSQEEIR